MVTAPNHGLSCRVYNPPVRSDCRAGCEVEFVGRLGDYVLVLSTEGVAIGIGTLVSQWRSSREM